MLKLLLRSNPTKRRFNMSTPSPVLGYKTVDLDPKNYYEEEIPSEVNIFKNEELNKSTGNRNFFLKIA